MDTSQYTEYRPLMFSIAYRMTGSVSDAEDIVQEAFLRAGKDGGKNGGKDGKDAEIESPKAYLATITTRLAIDHLRSARVRRESYVGTWLPEPLLASAPGTPGTPGAPRGEPDPAELAETSDSLSMAFLVLLESLAPAERAVFLLREVFGYDYSEIAGITGKTEAACRQTFARSRRRIDEGRPRFETSRAEGEELTALFLAAADGGDMASLLERLAPDVVFYEPDPAELAETSDSLSMAFLVLLESLAPAERAVFLLREVFGYDYSEIAGITGKTEAACRQTFARSRRRIDEGRPRFETSRAEGEELTALFLAAADGGDMASLLERLAPDVVFYGDSGGKGESFISPVLGRDRVARVIRFSFERMVFYGDSGGKGETTFITPVFGRDRVAQVIRLSFERTLEMGASLGAARVNGQPGVLARDADGDLIAVIVFDVLGGQVLAIRTVANPEKLRHLGPISRAWHERWGQREKQDEQN